MSLSENRKESGELLCKAVFPTCTLVNGVVSQKNLKWSLPNGWATHSH